jgi:hypothetical protein
MSARSSFSRPLCGVPGDCPDTATISIGLGAGFFTGSFAFTTTATIVSGGTFIDTSSADINLTPGETFVIDIADGQPASEPPTGPPPIAAIAFLGTPYAGGDLFEAPGADVTPSEGISMEFQTFVESSSTPGPGTLALFGSGLVGLICMSRKRA